jgi:hypothetical protein
MKDYEGGLIDRKPLHDYLMELAMTKNTVSVAKVISRLESQPTVDTAPVESKALTQDAPAQIIPASPPAFDYAGLDAKTAQHLRDLAEQAVSAKVKYMWDMANIVSEAHDELCGVVANCDNSKRGNRGENSFRAWCASIGISKDAAYRLLQVQSLLLGCTDEEQAVLAEAPTSLLYAAAKPSAPAELVQAVKDGGITTNKQFQDQLKEMQRQLAAEKQRADKAEQDLVEAFNTSSEWAAQNVELDKARSAAEERARQVEADAAEIARQLDTARAAAANANARVKELEARPVEVVGADPDEIERRAAAMAAEAGADLRRQLDDAAAENNALRKRAQDLDAEAERYAGQLGEAHMDILDLKDELASAEKAAQNGGTPDPVKQAQRAIEICTYALLPLIDLCTGKNTDTALPVRALLLEFINDLYDAAQLDTEPQDEEAQ